MKEENGCYDHLHRVSGIVYRCRIFVSPDSESESIFSVRSRRREKLLYSRALVSGASGVRQVHVSGLKTDD